MNDLLVMVDAHFSNCMGNTLPLNMYVGFVDIQYVYVCVSLCVRLCLKTLNVPADRSSCTDCPVADPIVIEYVSMSSF